MSGNGVTVHKYFLCAVCGRETADLDAHAAKHHPGQTKGRHRVRWRVNTELPPHSDGRRRRGGRKGFLTKAEAKAWEEQLAGELAKGHIPPSAKDRQTVAAYLRSWYAGVAGKATTRAHYRDMCEWYLLPYLGGCRLDELSAEQVDACYRALEQRGGRNKQGLSPKTVRLAHVVLHVALETAVERGYVRRNVASLAHPPTTKSTRSRNAERVWTVAQAQTWLRWLEARGDRLFAVWRLIATTGLRRGEACGLHWADVDLDDGVVRVRWELTVADGRPVWVDGAKSRAGERTVDLDGDTVAALRTHKAALAAERLVCGPAYTDLDLVVCWPDGTVMHPDRLLRALHRHAKALDLPRIDVHGLRHFYASVFLAGGGSYKVLQERLGHASAATTMDVYAHVSRDEHRQAAEDTARRITG